MDDIEPVEMEVLKDDNIDECPYGHCGLDSRYIPDIRRN